MMENTPKWLSWLERRLSWLAVPNIAILLVTLQGIGFLFVSMDPRWMERLALLPERVAGGEYWRLLTFLALPLSLSPLWVIFVLWFLYFVVTSVENYWGSFKTTLYVFISWFLMAVFSLAFGYPIAQIGHFESTLFLAAAALFPEQEISLFGIIPVKMKWLAAFSLVFVALELIRGGWLDRLFLVAIYSNTLLFFGPAMLGRVSAAYRRWKFRRQFK